MRLLCFLCLLALLINGCGKPLPEELRNLAPVKIIVVQKGEPIEDVLVFLVNDTTAVLLARGGITDAKGVATIETKMQSHVGKGVQPGAYTVTLTKGVPLPEDLQEKENEMDLPERDKAALDAKRQDFYTKNLVVPLSLGDKKTSPIKLTVTEKTGAELTVDIADI